MRVDEFGYISIEKGTGLRFQCEMDFETALLDLVSTGGTAYVFSWDGKTYCLTSENNLNEVRLILKDMGIKVTVWRQYTSTLYTTFALDVYSPFILAASIRAYATEGTRLQKAVQLETADDALERFRSPYRAVIFRAQRDTSKFPPSTFDVFASDVLLDVVLMITTEGFKAMKSDMGKQCPNHKIVHSDKRITIVNFGGILDNDISWILAHC